MTSITACVSRILCVSALLASAAAAQQPVEVAEGAANRSLPVGRGRVRDLPMPVKIDHRMRPGHVIARGNRVDVNQDGRILEDECTFDFGIEIALDAGRRTVTVGRGPDCTAVIEGIEDVDAVDVVDGRIARNGSAGPFGVARTLVTRAKELLFPTVSAQQLYFRKIVYGQIYMFGYGGQWADGLTAQQGWLDFRYNFSNAIQNGGSGWACVAGRNSLGNPNCLPPLGIPPMFPSNLGWIAFNFFYGDIYWGPGSVVTRLDYSSFTFTGNTIQHTLYNRRNGYANGTGSCATWLNGSYVMGWVSECQVYVP